MKGKLLFAMQLIVVTALSSGYPSENELRLIQTQADKDGRWVDREEISELLKNDVPFMDITNSRPPPKEQRNVTLRDFPAAMRYKTSVNSALDLIQTDRLKAFLDHFTSYHTRHYLSETGIEAAEWLYNEVKASIDSSNYAGKVDVKFWRHRFAVADPEIQPSVIARLEGSDSDLAKEIVIIGAHLDSIAEESSTVRSPGANDNASGSAVLLEAIRVLLQIPAALIPKRTVEFQWYAAEEEGLKGSLDIAGAYYNLGINVTSMVNFDMSGYFDEVRGIAIVSDPEYTDSNLNQFLKVAITEYCAVPVSTDINCTYACTDHTSFNAFGFSAGSPVDPVIMPMRHTEFDTVDIVNLDQLKEFTKLGIAYVMEMGEFEVAGKSASPVQLEITLVIFAQFVIASLMFS